MDELNDMNTTFDEIDGVLSEFDGVSVEGGADPSAEDDNCAGGACKI